jgi:hypothetical protein
MASAVPKPLFVATTSTDRSVASRSPGMGVSMNCAWPHLAAAVGGSSLTPVRRPRCRSCARDLVDELAEEPPPEFQRLWWSREAEQMFAGTAVVVGFVEDVAQMRDSRCCSLGHAVMQIDSVLAALDRVVALRLGRATDAAVLGRKLPDYGQQSFRDVDGVAGGTVLRDQ